MNRELLRFEILREADGIARQENEIVLLLCLSGILTAEVGDETVTLHTDDILLINPKMIYLLRGTDCLFVRYRISTADFREIFPQRRYRFSCNSSIEPNDNYSLLRRYLTNLLLLRYEGGEYARAESRRLVDELLIFLVGNFTITDLHLESSEKIDAVADYIAANFREDLSLEQISRQFLMAPPSFSRYFKKQMGVSFYQYLSAVRLEHSVEDLLSTDKNILHVALDNGFPNAKSFNRYFQEAFAVSPQKYRNQHRAIRQDWQAQQQEALSLAVARLDQAQLRPDPAQRLLLTVDTTQMQPYTKYWSKAVNLGAAELMMDYEGQTQIRHLQEELEFEYARIELDGSAFTGTADYSFFIEERKLDYLVHQKLNLWLVIDFRTTEDKPNFLCYLQRFLSHFSNRYSLSTIRPWRFELVYNTLFHTEKAEAYWTFYQQITQVLRSFEIDEALLGPGMTLGNWRGLRAFYEYMEQNGLSLPAQTLSAEPYTCHITDDGISVTRTTDSSYIKNMLLGLRQHSRFFRQEVKHIYITSWVDTLLHTNLMNDSCYRGATIIKNIIDCFGTVDILAHGMPFDAAYQENLQGSVLFGGDGLLSKHGLHKPSFYAYYFMHRVGDYYLTRDEHSIVFGNGETNYQILCHNRKRLSHRYYLDEGRLTWDHFPDYFDDLEPLELSYQLTGMKNGTYVVKSRSVSQAHGSVQDEFYRMAEDETVYIHRNDLDYLRQVSVPQVRLKIYTVTDGTLSLPVTLSANEFCYLHIIYQY